MSASPQPAGGRHNREGCPGWYFAVLRDPGRGAEALVCAGCGSLRVVEGFGGGG